MTVGTNNEISNSLANWLLPRTQTGRKWFEQKIAATLQSKHTDNTTFLGLASLKSKKFSKIAADEELNKEIQKLAKIEPELEEILREKNDMENESTGELLFLGEIFQPFNFIPFVLACWSIIRVYIFPIFSMIMPILILILPFFILRYIMNLPITTDKYFFLLKSLIFNSMPNAMGSMAFGFGIASADSQPKTSIIPIASFLFTTLQVSIQGYWNWRHLSNIDTIILKKGATIERFIKIYKSVSFILEKYGVKIMRMTLPDLNDSRQTVAMATLYPAYLRLHLQALAEVDVWLGLGHKISGGDACVVRWKVFKNPNTQFIQLKGIYDPACAKENRVPINYSIGAGAGADAGAGAGAPNHFLLTGPNRGGKSTALRALAQSLVLAHTFGCSLGQVATLTPLAHFSICLRPDDLPGQKSRFEREVGFAWGCLRKQGRQLVLIDELFHSTNPPDAEEASRIFAVKLWKRPNTASIISTHLFSFVEGAPESVGRLCCPASLDAETGKILFTYRVEPGICTVSSVKELIDCAARVPAPAPKVHS